MVDERKVFEVAGALQAQGRRVSVRAVRVALGRKGSYRDIGRLVSRWKTARSYEPHKVVDGVPRPVQDLHGKALSALWAAAHALASDGFEDERRRTREAVLASDEVRDEALHEVDRLDEEVTALRSEVVRLRGLLERRDAHVGRMRSEEFWTRTMQEIYDLMPSRGTMTIEEILPCLRDSAWRETANHGGNLNAGILRKKMRTRAAHGKYFLARDDGSFERRPTAGCRAEMPDVPDGS